MKQLETINVGSTPHSAREAVLSNFSPHPVVLRGKLYTGVEAFVQSIKYSELSVERNEIAQMRAPKAKRKSPKTPPKFIEWEGRQIPYRSFEHIQLHAAAIFAKYDQNPDALEILLATGKLPLIHDLSVINPNWVERPTTCLPAAEFCQILVEARQYFFKQMGVDDRVLIGTTEPMYVTDDLVSYARSID